MARVEPRSGEIHQTCIGSQCLGGRHTHSVALGSSALSSFLSSSKNGTREKTVIRRLMLLLF